MTTLQQFAPGGWAEVNSEGISTIYLSIVDEGMVTSPTDTPANTQFRPRVLNPEQFSIKRAPPVWPQASTSGVQAAAYGQLQIDNYDGAFDFLISADLRDTTVVFKLPAAGSLLTGTVMNSAPTMATAIIDTASCSNEDVITLSLKDTIARLDKVLPVRFNPPFVDANAAAKMIQISLGPFRNRGLQLIDTANRLFQAADQTLTSITRVTDMAAPLDPTAVPPQYTLALDNSGLQLAAMPVGLLTCEGCVVGGGNTSAIVPTGTQDILNGAGLFPGSQAGTTLATAWLGQYGYGSTTSGAITGAGPYTVPVTAAASPALANGTQVYLSDGTNKLLGTISAGGGTTTWTVAAQNTAGTVTSIATGSPAVQTGAPTGWKTTRDANTTFASATTTPFPMSGSNGCFCHTTDMWWEALSPSGNGAVLSYETAVLAPGSTYRISFGLYNVQYCGILDAGGFFGGVIVSTAISNKAADYVAGFFNPLHTTAFQQEQFVFEYTVPPGGSNRKLYFMFTPTVGQPLPTIKNSVFASVFAVKVQLLGQYIAQPLRPISMTDYFTEILVNRAGEASTVFNSTDTNALAVHPLSAADTNLGNNTNPLDNLVGFACCFDSPPNILDALRMALDNFCATLFTDNLGVLRARRLIDPSDPTGRVVKADFTTINVKRPIEVYEDPASMLTTLFGARRNWKVFGAPDFVTDQGIVTQNTRAMFGRTSQYQIRSMKTPASNYSFAVGAPQFDTTIDVPNDCQLECDRVVGIWSPSVYPDGTVTTGKRRIVTFTAFWDDPTALGINTTCAVTALGFGDIVTLLYPTHGFNTPTYGAVLQWEIFPFAQQIKLTLLV